VPADCKDPPNIPCRTQVTLSTSNRGGERFAWHWMECAGVHYACPTHNPPSLCITPARTPSPLSTASPPMQHVSHRKGGFAQTRPTNPTNKQEERAVRRCEEESEEDVPSASCAYQSHPSMLPLLPPSSCRVAISLHQTAPAHKYF
jgi:hypothetical protein